MYTCLKPARAGEANPRRTRRRRDLSDADMLALIGCTLLAQKEREPSDPVVRRDW